MLCDERDRLLGLYNCGALAISITVDDLLHGVGPVSRIMYNIRRHAAAKARHGFELARLAYENHINEHGCETSILIASKSVNYSEEEISASQYRR